MMTSCGGVIARACRRARGPAASLILVPFLVSFAVVPLSAQSRQWRIDTDASRVVVHVHAAGLLSPFLKDHHLTPEEWSGRLSFDPDQPGAVEIVVDVVADSLRNLQEDLSREDYETVAGQVRGPDVLHVEQYPRIRFTAHRLEIEEQTAENGMQVVRGTLTGDLTVRDTSRPIQIPLAARWSDGWLRAAGQTSFRQTDFGIEPYRRALGTIAVADRLRVEIEIEATPEATDTD